MPSPSASFIDIAALAVSVLGLIGLLFAFLQFRLSRKANEVSAQAARSSFVLEIHKWLREDSDEVRLFYRLDYGSKSEAFKFDPNKFPHSEDEQNLDAMLYKLVFVGGLLRRGVLDLNEIAWMKFVVSTVMENREIQAYLRWLQTPGQIPGHSEFVDAVFLYQKLQKNPFDRSDVLEEYIESAET
ncbi:hypothetical protein [Rhodovulum kholense]|uniref:hypothetical protein n=1 Tax=Rhodovulum kholense TaxID=453584 RepID=UPI0011B22AC4|nr:hypothetical protein [Rhodovulum kholense]